jgi:hypothetical protein
MKNKAGHKLFMGKRDGMRDDKKKIEKIYGFSTGESSSVSRYSPCGSTSENEEKTHPDRGRRWSSAGTGRRGDSSQGPC